MEREIKCPRCGEMTWYVYRRKSDGVFVGCEHCAELLDESIGYFDTRDYPEDYKPYVSACPVCGERCRDLYRAQGGYGAVVGCDRCLKVENGGGQ